MSVVAIVVSVNLKVHVFYIELPKMLLKLVLANFFTVACNFYMKR